MKVKTYNIEFSTTHELEMHDLTYEVEKYVSSSGIKNGIGLVFAIGSTCAITTFEFEPGLEKDIRDALNRLFPKDIFYEHHYRWGDYNGHSHVRASFLKQDFTFPIVNGKAILGTWQQIVFIEFDIKPRRRRVVLQLMGE